MYGEAGRVEKFKATCDEGKFTSNKEELLGNLMNCSHESCRELFKCSVPQLDELVDVCRFVLKRRQGGVCLIISDFSTIPFKVG